MATNETATARNGQSSEISLRVIALAHATNENEDVYLNTSLDTTISQLKNRLQQELSHHPHPETQRLIYQGRALVDGSTTLRQTLRLDANSTNDSTVHVLHLVVREDQSNFNPTTNPQPAQQVQDQQTPPPPPPPPLGFIQHGIPQGRPAQAMLQNVMQQHMAVHNEYFNRFHPNGHQPPFPMPAMNIPQIPQMPATIQRPSRASTPQPTSNLHTPSTATGSNTPSTTIPTSNSTPNVFQNSMSMRVHETIGPHGERIHRVVQSGPIFPTPTNPVERSASAPGQPRSSTPNAATHLNPNFLNLPHLAPMFPQMQQPHLHNLPRTFGGMNQMPPNIMQPPLLNQNRDPVAFLVSSPNGPEALLFAPQHGYFSTQRTTTTTQSTSQTQAQTNDPPNQHSPQSILTQAAQQARNTQRNDNQGQVAVRPQGPAAGQAQVQAQGRREGEDMIALILQRGWLFLRLYMFIFVLSEPGTWRRYILLTIASLVCLLPRNNPFTDLFQIVRRHFDNLIGPPQAPGQPRLNPNREQPRNQNVNGTGSPVATNTGRVTEPANTGHQMPTPAEHARRLLRDHEQRNPSVVRDTIYRIEQAVALFLASLIPGVGERHVRAREEARRIVHEEEERRRREEEANRQQDGDTNNKIGDDVEATAASNPADGESNAVSTGVETASASTSATPSTTDRGLRMRGSEAVQQASSSSS